MFNKILIANRGEIACRIMRTASAMGITTVAVYSEADRDGLHVRTADEAYLIGRPPATESYLNGKRIVEVALEAGAEAVHPGYGFLSENPEFARQCTESGLVFIGPPAEVIKEMGIKSRAKTLMEEAGIPVIPGYHGSVQESRVLTEKAAAIGFPLLIKADRGGGGKGIRLVHTMEEFDNALAEAQREAAGAFDDHHVILEKYLTSARHIEIQIFRDFHGNGVHLFERDCSLQRRHQKIIEESPAAGLSDQLRQDLFQAALKAAHTINYVGAGTVEFLVDTTGNFYFMEINTRLQVEHPVSEMVTGTDLVKWQFLVAAGKQLPCRQEDITCNAHSIEARIYAEDPANDFLPSSGKIRYLHVPSTSEDIRLDIGICAGDAISPFYDPILAKLIVQGETRQEAVKRLQCSLKEFLPAGIATNIEFLNRLCREACFREASYDITSIDASIARLTKKRPPGDDLIGAAGLIVLMGEAQDSRQRAENSNEPNSPWNSNRGYRLNEGCRRRVSLLHDNRRFELTISFTQEGFRLKTESGREAMIQAHLAEADRLTTHTPLGTADYRFACWANTLVIFEQGTPYVFAVNGRQQYAATDEQSDTDFRSPIPAIISTVQVTPGTRVKKGDVLLSLEAMKMEYTIKAPENGTVEEVLCNSGDQVNEGDRLIIFKGK